MDTVIWLLEQGVDPGKITWIRPRDSWLINRRVMQISFDFFAGTVGGLVAELESARDATSIEDLFARYFAAKLIDFDLASNNGGWQWAASTGCDAQPYFRIFNPVAQSEKFDAQGEFIRRHLPELAGVPAKFIHAPWKLSPVEQSACGCVIGRDYPAPVVDHAVQRERALALYKKARP